MTQDNPQRERVIMNVTIPAAEGTNERYQVRHVDFRLTPRQATALRLVFDGCDTERLESGCRVANANDTVRFILERIADAAGVPR